MAANNNLTAEQLAALDQNAQTNAVTPVAAIVADKQWAWIAIAFLIGFALYRGLWKK